jgi:hypothetical protein
MSQRNPLATVNRVELFIYSQGLQGTDEKRQVKLVVYQTQSGPPGLAC